MSAMNSLNCIVLNDNHSANKLLESYISKVPFLRLLDICNTPQDAMIKIQGRHPDIVFIDVEVPQVFGFELLSLLPEPRPSIIMITSDPSYAVEGFSQQVTDYILKPFTFDRFMRSIKRAQTEKQSQSHRNISNGINFYQGTTLEDTHEQAKFLLVKEKKKLTRIDPLEIQCVEGMRDYLKIHFIDRVSILHLTLAKIEDRLPNPPFLRVHKSFIINKDSIKEIDGNELSLTNGKKIVIGLTFRNSLFESLQNNLI